jgi:hypothetical protein
LQVFAQAAPVGKVQPAAEVGDGGLAARLLRDLSGKVLRPVIAQLQRCFAHLGQIKLGCDALGVVPKRGFELHPMGGLLGCQHHQISQALHRNRPGLGIKVRVGRKLVVQRLFGQLLERTFEVGRHRWAQDQRGVEAEIVLVDRLCGVQRFLGHAVESIGRVQTVANELAQLVPLVRQQHACLLTVGLRQLAGVLVQVVATQHEIDDHQPAQLVLRVGRQEGRQPGHRATDPAVVEEAVDLGHIVLRTVFGLVVEREVDQDAPRPFTPLEGVEGLLADVAKQNLRIAARTAPTDLHLRGSRLEPTSASPKPSVISCLTSACRFPCVSNDIALARMASVSTLATSTDTIGFGESSAILISPAWPAQRLSLVSTVMPSLPGTGVRIVPWFSAASLVGVRFFSASTSGTKAANTRVLSRRASFCSAAAFLGSALPASMSSQVTPCWVSRIGNKRRRQSCLACSKKSLMPWVKGSSPSAITSNRSPTGMTSPISSVSALSTSICCISLSAVRSRCSIDDTAIKV